MLLTLILFSLGGHENLTALVWQSLVDVGWTTDF